MNCGIVDLGSNTIRLSIFKCEGGEVSLLLHRKIMAGLASYVQSGMLTNSGVQVACRVLKVYRALLDNLGIEPMYVFATASLRNIANTTEVVEAIRAETGLTVDLLSGEEEARLSFDGALLGIQHTSGLLVDIGGGSTELVRYSDGEILSACSLSVGSLNLFDRYVSWIHPTGTERKAIRSAVRTQLEHEKADLHRAEHICGVGGSVRAACKAANRLFNRPASCRVLSASEIKLLLKRFKNPDRTTLSELLKIAPDRVHTIIPGLLVLDTICSACSAADVTASACGVREGYLRTKILGEMQ
ncbi:MAG: phosphatase [Oscillospiraceae bacterium]|nr:phosphatase [Oscillospiraceae bacterium]MCD8374446.1 phosphatase [Oscillospiraceae bacterium]